MLYSLETFPVRDQVNEGNVDDQNPAFACELLQVESLDLRNQSAATGYDSNGLEHERRLAKISYARGC